MTENSPEAHLVQGLEAVAEDALFAVAAAGEDDENVLGGLGKRRSDFYERVVRGQARIALSSFRDWSTNLAAAIAPVRPAAVDADGASWFGRCHGRRRRARRASALHVQAERKAGRARAPCGSARGPSSGGGARRGRRCSTPTSRT